MSEATRKRHDNKVDLRAIAQQGTVHFVGVCGSGMSALAELLLQDGGRVSGCDTHLTASAQRLRELGAHIYQGHDVAHVENVAAVVMTAAVPWTRPSWPPPRRCGFPCSSARRRSATS